MSGICGIVGLGGGALESDEIAAMLAPLARRGPDGSRSWAGQEAIFGHALLATTPEARAEELPMHDPTSDCAITADVRLDNRDQLITELGLSVEQRAIGDGELILLSYLTWNEDCVDHLLGDFAFAIWDQRAGTLFGARDHLGMRQLAYSHVAGERFLFATEPAAILGHRSAPKAIDFGRIADFFDEMEAGASASTWFEGVSKLPPAHCLTLDQRGLRLRKYWRLDTPPTLCLGSDRDYEAAFLDVFSEAVKCRLRSPGPVAAMLSGGMDSGSVAAVAVKLLDDSGLGALSTYSVIGPNPANCVETRAILAAAAMDNIDPHFISTSDLGCRSELLKLTREQSDPFDGEMGLLRAVYLAAHRNGIKVVLDGVGGDLVMGPHSHAARLFKNGRILAGLREARGESAFWGSGWPAWKAVGLAAGRAFVPRRLRALRRRIKWALEDRRFIGKPLISQEFEARSGLRDRRREVRLRDRFFDRIDAGERARRIDHERFAAARERYDRVASALAIEPRDPFMDLRVIRFALSLPDSQLQQFGWPKILLRRAMAGRLPESVCWRRGKEHLGGEFTLDLLEGAPVGQLAEEAMIQSLSPYLVIERTPLGPARPPEKLDCADWVKAICLHYWLRSALVRGLK